MITVKWQGIFVSCLGRTHVSTLRFSGNSMENVSSQIREFIECMEDDQKNCWILKSEIVLETIYKK